MYYDGICMRKNDTTSENEVQDWGSYMAAKKAKLEDQYRDLVQNEFQNATDLFKGIAIFVNGWTNPCADELRRLMMQHGGVYHIYQRSGSTTHVIATNLTNTKIKEYLKAKNALPVCKPEWITDSIKANKLLDWRRYLLYTHATITQPQLQFKNKINPTHTVTGDPKIPFDPGPSTSTAWNFVDPVEIAPDTNMNSTKAKSPQIKESKPNNGALCTKNDEFLTEFYNNSRLHHISTMGATFKEYVNELRLKKPELLPGLARLKQFKRESGKKVTTAMHESDSEDDMFNSPDFCDEVKEKGTIIMHIDMDCFFVSVGLKNKPELRGLPVAVTHARGHKPTTNTNENEEQFESMAEIASCSYEARKAGLKNGMFLGQALKLCPNLKMIKYDFEGYKEVSYLLYDTVASYTLDIEAVSCDEMYADVSTILQDCDITALEFATIIRNEIKEKTGCPVSTGFGQNKLQARLATKRAKPDGQFHLKDADAQAYIGGMGVRDIPGVGYTTMKQLKKMNVHLCSDLRTISLNVLQTEFGKKTGEMLYNTCRGIDLSKLNIEHVRKSVSSEVNYGIRFENDNDARNFFRKLSKEVVSRLTKINAKGKCITLKLMVRAKDAPVEPAKFMGHGLCDNFTKSKNLLTPIDDETIITKEVLSLWDQLQQPAHEIRGVGIQISRLETLKKQPDTYMTKFIAQAKRTTSETVKSVDNAIPRSVKKPQVSKIPNNRRESDTKQVSEKQKPQGLKAFFTAKKTSAPAQKSVEECNDFPAPTEIDEAVLAELPDDIKMEIENYQRGKSEITGRVSEEVKAPPLCQDSEKSGDGIFPLTQDIDEAVLNELPSDIRDEILALKSSKKIITNTVKKDISQSEQPRPENYFKQVKPGRSNRGKLPDIEQLDMKVLVELPDDIRNEILDHYKANHEGDVANVDRDHSPTVGDNNKAITDHHNQPKCSRNMTDDINVSFSQIDPEFLSALTDDIKDDVRMYCMAQKRKTMLNLKKASAQPSESVKAQNVIVAKKRGRKPKAMQNNVLPKSKLASKTKLSDNKNNKGESDSIDNQALRRDRSFLQDEITILHNDNVVMKDRRDDIKLHQSSFVETTEKSDEYQEMLTNLVNHLFNLPMRQVKNQIETWMTKCDHVNEIDVISLATFLSMLPKERRLEDLHVLMRTMHRCMTEIGSCIWHETYSRTVEHVQHHMQIEYNSNLMLPPIRCNLRECKSNHV